jgi:phosphonate transport system substrate-binding protein
MMRGAFSLKMCLLLVSLTTVTIFFGCTMKKPELGTEKNPVKLFFIPSVDAKVIEDQSAVFKTYLESVTPYKFEVSIPQSYIAVVESFGTKKADVAAFTTYGYILAHEKYGVQARMTVLRHGSADYKSQFIVRKDSTINSLADLNQKKIAFVDPASASGYLLPLKTLKDQKVQPKEKVFAGKHDNVVTMVYNKQVEAGATFWSPKDKEGIQDARRLVLTQFPDVEDKIKILDLTQSIPNDPIVFRRDMPEEMKVKIEEAFIKFIGTPEGRDAFKKIYGVDGIKKSSDRDYDGVRSMLKELGQDAAELLKK